MSDRLVQSNSWRRQNAAAGGQSRGREGELGSLSGQGFEPAPWDCLTDQNVKRAINWPLLGWAPAPFAKATNPYPPDSSPASEPILPPCAVTVAGLLAGRPKNGAESAGKE